MQRFIPFVYLSESLVAQNDALKLISQTATDRGYQPNLQLIEDVWYQATKTTKSQLKKYQMYRDNPKPLAYRKWLMQVIDRMMPVILGTSTSANSDGQLAQEIYQQLTRIQNFSVPAETQDFLEHLQDAGIQWGLIANDNFMFQAVVKYLNLKPHHVISARDNFFKPLPAVFYKAWSRVPNSSQYDTWFIGSSENQYDNVANEKMRCVTFTNGAVSDPPTGKKFRVARLEELLPVLGIGGYDSALDLDYIKDDGLDDEVELRTFDAAPLIDWGDRDQGLVDASAEKKSRVELEIK